MRNLSAGLVVDGIFSVTLALQRTSRLMMVSREGTGTLKTWAEVVWEIALNGIAVTFCPPLKTPNLTAGVNTSNSVIFDEHFFKGLGHVRLYIN
jgi:hypothetical protein